jgi:hypothetical protein
MDDHVDSDYFVLLDEDALRRERMSVSEIGDPANYYKGVTVGRTLIETPAKSWAHNAVALKPWAPANVQSSVDGSDNIDITWDRRDRIIGRALWDPPMSEDYKVEIMDGETIIRTITSTASAGGSVVSGATAEYTSADQVADWGQNMAILDIKVYQYSQTLVDWGYPAEVRIGVPDDFHAVVLADSPVCFYRFNEASGTPVTDDSVNVDHGTYEDTDDAYQEDGGLITDGKGAKYLSIDNAAFISENIVQDLDVDVSYEFVFLATTGDNGTYDIRHIADFAGSIGLYWTVTNGPMKALIRVDGGSYQYASQDSSIAPVINVTANTWYHVVLTFEDASFKFYIDGILRKDKAITAGYTIDERYSAAGNRTIGRREWESTKSAKGGACRWSAFAAYDFVLTPAAIKQRYFATKAALK